MRDAQRVLVRGLQNKVRLLLTGLCLSESLSRAQNGSPSARSSTKSQAARLSSSRTARSLDAEFAFLSLDASLDSKNAKDGAYQMTVNEEEYEMIIARRSQLDAISKLLSKWVPAKAVNTICFHLGLCKTERI